MNAVVYLVFVYDWDTNDNGIIYRFSRQHHRCFTKRADADLAAILWNRSHVRQVARTPDQYDVSIWGTSDQNEALLDRFRERLVTDPDRPQKLLISSEWYLSPWFPEELTDEDCDALAALGSSWRDATVEEIPVE